MATNFSTYGMVGVGIAAAIGFVFALSFFGGNSSSNNNGGEVVDDGQLLQKQSAPAEEQQRAASAPTASDEQGPGGEAALFAKDNNESGEAAGSAPAEESANSSSMMQAADIRPELVSIVELDANREVKGDVVPGTEFKDGEPVIIRATFANNNNDAIVHDHLISMSLRPVADGESGSISNESGPFEHAASFHGDIGSNSAVDLELYWVPQQAGDFTLLVFSVTPGDLTSTVPVAPVAGIPISVSEE